MQLLSFCCGIIIAGLLQHAGVRGFQAPGDFGNILVATLSFQGATWVLIPFFLKRHGVGWRDLIGVLDTGVARAVGWTLGVLVLALVMEYAYEIVLSRVHWRPEDQMALDILKKASFWPTGFYLGFFAVVIAPVAEEFIFRGILFPLIKQLGYPKVAWFWVSFLFALIHMSVGIFIPLFVLALVLTWLYEKTDNLLAPIAAHSLFNAANLGLFYLFPDHGGI
jgi:membrane protease YdiL (CAAX protease family)